MILRGVERRWELKPVDDALVGEITSGLGVSELLARVLVARGSGSVSDAGDFLAAGDAPLADARLLPDAGLVVARVARALETGEQIAVHGHDDADGVCATIIMVEALEQLGANPLHYVPDRRREGHGLSRGEIDGLASSSVGLVITVDSCVSDRELIAYASELGIDTIVTDHHEIPPTLPDAVAVVNPKLPDSPFPYRYMAGVGVSLRVAELLLDELSGRFRGRSVRPWSGSRWGDEAFALAAIGSISDKVPLTGENRKIVARGLVATARTERPGLRAMLSESGLWGRELEPSDVRESLGPIFGRVSDGRGGNEALTALISADEDEARTVARRLAEGRGLWRESANAAWRKASRDLDLAALKEAGNVVVIEADVPIEVLGYVTNRLADEMGRPAIVIAPKGDEVMGEARGPYGFNLVEAFSTMPELFLGYGGHPRAAGFSAKPDVTRDFKSRMKEYARANPPAPPPRVVDAEFDLARLTPAAATDLERLRPFGFGNGRAVLLARSVTSETVESARSNRIHLGTPSRFGRTPCDVVYRVRPADEIALVHVLETVQEESGG
ncbi:MAG: DHH family phosphoesterase [Candidatus Eisenbacteria bacterium]